MNVTKESEIKRCSMTYSDKVVLITGGSQGIGKGCARVFVDAGATVVICARGAEKGEALATELSERGPGACHFELCDVSVPDQIEQLLDRTIELYGRLDCLINNAGYHPPHKPIDEFTLDELHHNMQTNFYSYFIAARRALPHLRKVKGNIINMGSMVGAVGQEGATVYCATKGAISAFTKALAIEEARFGVRVNAVLPGNILTESRAAFVASRTDGKEIDAWADTNQLFGRSGTIEETGQVCLFLASDAASFLTGIEIFVTAGAELGLGAKYPPRLLK